MTQGVISGQLPKASKSVQYGTITLTNTTSNTATINSVNTSNSILLYLGITNDDGNESPPYEENLVRIDLTNSTTITAYVNTNSDNTLVVNFCVLEFDTDIVKSNQKGTITLDYSGSELSDTVTVSSVNTNKSFLSWLGCTTDISNHGENSPSSNLGRITLTNSTTITANRGYYYADLIIGYQLIEFN